MRDPQDGSRTSQKGKRGVRQSPRSPLSGKSCTRPIFLDSFPKNCMKMKNCIDRGGEEGHIPGTPFDLTMVRCSILTKILAGWILNSSVRGRVSRLSFEFETIVVVRRSQLVHIGD